MTELIYLKDCYCKEFDAQVLESGNTSEHEFFVVLDKTAFYPEGGGQMSDIGFLEVDEKQIKVFQVSKKGGEGVRHWTKEAIPKDAKVHGVVDWKKRYSQMQMHTAQHVLSAIALDNYGAATVGNKLKEGECRIDFKPLEWSDDLQQFLEKEFNKAVDKAYPIHFEFITRKELIERVDEKRRRIFERLPEAITNIRLVVVENIDMSPCAGTHVKNTSELGHIKILRTENKGSQTRRIYYKLKKSG